MKTAKIILVSVILTMLMGFTAFAGEWKQDSVGWWYQNDDGNYTTSNWQWIDGNKDGISECYYFDSNGYCLMNTTTPDGNTVDGNGAWVVNGVVQTQPAAGTNTDAANTSNATIANNTATNTAGTNTDTPDTNAVSGTSGASDETASMVWISATGEKYHAIPNCGRMNPAKARQMSVSDAISRGYTPCSKCY